MPAKKNTPPPKKSKLYILNILFIITMDVVWSDDKEMETKIKLNRVSFNQSQDLQQHKCGLLGTNRNHKFYYSH